MEAWALVDAENFPAALAALREAVLARSEDRGLSGQLGPGPALRIAVPEGAFEGEDKTALLDSVFVVSPEREILPGLARARALLEGQGATLTFVDGDLVATLAPSARPNPKA